jgi:hypothetical protein
MKATSQGLRVLSRPMAAQLSGQSCLGFCLKATEFSSHLRGLPRWLCLARSLGSAHSMCLKCCQSHSFVLTVMRVVGGSGCLCFYKNWGCAMPLAAVQSWGMNGSSLTEWKKNWHLYSPLALSCPVSVGPHTKKGEVCYYHATFICGETDAQRGWDVLPITLLSSSRSRVRTTKLAETALCPLGQQHFRELRYRKSC